MTVDKSKLARYFVLAYMFLLVALRINEQDNLEHSKGLAHLMIEVGSRHILEFEETFHKCKKESGNKF